jgi:cytochrome P450
LLLEERKKMEQHSETEKITDRDIIDDIKTFVIAGTDTTSNFITAMLLYVYEKESTVKRLTEEINNVIKSDADITAENLKKMPYLDCCIAETSRVITIAVGLFER